MFGYPHRAGLFNAIRKGEFPPPDSEGIRLASRKPLFYWKLSTLQEYKQQQKK